MSNSMKPVLSGYKQWVVSTQPDSTSYNQVESHKCAEDELPGYKMWQVSQQNDWATGNSLLHKDVERRFFKESVGF